MEESLPQDQLRSNCASRLPSFRNADLYFTSLPGGLSLADAQASELASDLANGKTTHLNLILKQKSPPHHRHHHSTQIAASPQRQWPPRRSSFPSSTPPKIDHDSALEFNLASQTQPSFNSHARSKPEKKARIPASHSRNGLLEESKKEGRKPPAAMITQNIKLDTTTGTSTSTWVASQAKQSITIPSPSQVPPSPAQPTSARSTDTTGSRPLIKPIRGFKPSSRKSTEMALRRTSTDADHTLRALEGYTYSRRISNPSDQDDPNSDESDMFLRAAREEEMSRQAGNGQVETLNRSDSRKSRIGQRSSLPPSTTSYQSPTSRRRGSDQEGSNASRPMDEQGNVGQVLTYRPSEKDRAPAALDDINRSRFYGGNSRSNPTTPRAVGNREISPESLTYNGRIPSDPSPVLPPRSSYRQSNLSYSTPRNYNSSPLVSRSTDMHDAPTPETPRAADGTESTVSTTAPSTVWDELEDLKSRIHRLELTGKLPATSGAAISRASNERPPTATTTVTTMSTSPKQRGRGNSISPIEADSQTTEVHPLLHAALAKSKSILSPEIFQALEATASDALAIASMMGTSGQPGPISSSQSTVGSTVSDRQVVERQTACAEVLQSYPISTDLARVKASPRALSRLEARRSSLLATSTLPSPRYAPSESGTPTQASMAGRRTSLLLRSRRGATEEPEEDDDTRFRAPSRATTEIGRLRNSQREYVSQEPIPERTLSIQSSLPVRRHITTSSLPSNGAPAAPLSNLSGRRYLDRSTPERDVTTIPGRLMEDRGQRKSSIGQGFALGRTGSLTRRARQPSATDSSPAGQGSGYQ
ncbi:hypothetical protein G7Y89_g12474 [Cudoniella acicularis]|uniref:Uncharacterized protein n=1 Tax=Cudoniella acicularis TaxID=354080 RepID=A0A8H4VWX6_9HELO|nr:hypothetical protein G7Y89_g12474 [Cudoniella acicularis]